MKKVLTFLLSSSLVTFTMAAVTMAKHVVSNPEYCEFLNSVAREGNSVGLWNPLMQDHWWGGIERIEDEECRTRSDGCGSPHYRYRVKTGYERKPATCVTWESAARYCNWLSYGKPNTGRAEVGTTEGTDACGVYDTRAFGTDEFVRSSKPVKRQSDKAYFLPTAEEWRQVAFSGENVGSANVYDGHWALPYPHLADVDWGMTNGLGHVNMLGNVGEWVESRRPNSNFFLALGGSLIRGPYSIKPDFLEGDESNRAISSFGFRVAHAENPIVQKASAPSSLVPSSSLSGSFSWCRIGDEGNARDPIYKVGRVDYTFEMAKCPVTNAEWCEFMNAIGVARSKALGLYNPDMTSGVCGGIELGNSAIQTAGQFEPKPGYANRPVVYISYRDAMRYCNYLQSGDTENGPYDVSKPNARRKPGAKYFIPTDDEWCKAAYYDPTRLGARKYWDYPCRTSDLPPNDASLPHACNYLRDGVHLGEKGPFYLSEVTAYPTSDTYYGCRQMAGNVWEWVEPVATDKLNLRGGSFGYTEFGMGIWNRDEAGFEDELNVFGLRIARMVERPKVVKQSVCEQMHEWVEDVPIKRLALGCVGVLFFVAVVGCVVGKLMPIVSNGSR